MREIKFRAYIDKDVIGEEKGLMHYPNDPSDFELVCNGDGGFSMVIDHEYWVESDKFIIMQYTGLKDKNGQGAEMYQGDIVYGAGHGNGVVDKNYWGEWGLKYKGEFMPIHDLVMEGDLGEIKGNIHENPELLEQQK